MKTFTKILLAATLIVAFTAGSVGAAGLFDRDPQWIRSQWNFYKDVTFNTPDCEVTFEDDVDFQGNLDIVLGATENVVIDGATTAQTQTDGALDLNFESLTTGTEGINVNTNITSTAGAVTISGIDINLDDDSSGGTPVVQGITIGASDVTGSGSVIGINLANSLEIGANIVVGAANQAAVIDAHTTANTGVAGAIDASYKSLTNGAEFMNILANITSSAGTVKVAGIVLDLDDDSSAGTPTVVGLDIDSSDATGSGSVEGINTGSTLDIGIDMLVGAAAKAIVVDAATTDNTGTAGVLDYSYDTLTTTGVFMHIDSAFVAGGASGETIDVVVIDTDDDSDAAGTFTGLSVLCSDPTGSSVMVGIEAYGHDTDLLLGVADTDYGLTIISGQATGSVQGGIIRLETAADHDTTINSFDIQATSATLTIGPSTDSDLLTLTGGDLTLADDPTGGNAGAKNQLSALPKLAFVSLNTMTNGTTETVTYMDDSPIGEWTQVTVTAPPTLTDDATYYRIGAKSLKMAWGATAVDGDGTTHTITNDNLEANESIGFWFYTDTALEAAWLELVITDDGGARTFNFPAVATINVWTWIEIDVSALAAGTGDICSAVLILMSAAGEAGLGAFNCYVDGMWKWDAADEEALGQSIKDYGVLGVITVTDAAAGANRQLTIVENTDFFVHYESGVDFIVTVTDQSTFAGLAVVAY